METKTQTELEKRVEEAVKLHYPDLNCMCGEPCEGPCSYCQLVLDFEKCTKFILEMPELKEVARILFKAYEEYRKDNDHAGTWGENENGHWVLLDHSNDCLTCEFEEAISKLRAMGVL